VCTPLIVLKPEYFYILNNILLVKTGALDIHIESFCIIVIINLMKQNLHFLSGNPTFNSQFRILFDKQQHIECQSLIPVNDPYNIID